MNTNTLIRVLIFFIFTLIFIGCKDRDKASYQTNEEYFDLEYAKIPSERPCSAPEIIRYKATGTYEQIDDFLKINISIPVSVKTFETDYIETFKFNNKNLSAIIIVLKNGETEDTDEEATYLLEGTMQIDQGKAKNCFIERKQKIRVYVIHHECYDTDRKEIEKILKEDLKKFAKSAYQEYSYSDAQQKIQQIRSRCKGHKPAILMPKTSNGGVITFQ